MPARPAGVRDARVVRTHLMRFRRKLGKDADSPKYIFADRTPGCHTPKGETRAPQTEPQPPGVS